MPYQVLDLPAGQRANGTVYQNRGRWFDGNRVRWHHGLLQPIGGWDKFATDVGVLDQVLTDPDNDKSRAIHSWKSNDGTNVFAIGHNSGLMAFTRASNTVFDITPVGFTPVVSGPSTSDGYGDWFYGSEAYGTQRPVGEAIVPIFNWCFRNWGEFLLAAPRGAASSLYEWQTSLGTPAAVVVNAPTDFDCFHVTEQRIVMVAGSALEPRLVTWSTSEDNTVWTPTTTNQAGFQILPGTGKFKEIIDFRDLILLISETDAHVARYLGPPYVYGFDKVGDNCGVVTGAAVVATEDFVVWPGAKDFFIYDGSVRRMECDVMDKLKDALSGINAGKVVGFINSEWAEIWWLFQSTDSADDVDSYVAWDYIENHWHTGTLDRTSGGGLPITFGPMMMGNDGFLYSHELSGVVPSETSASEVFVESGPIELKGGNLTQYIGEIQPDFIDNGSVNLFLIGQDRPGGPETTFGPYVVSYPSNTNQPIPCRARGLTVRLRVEGLSSIWSLGALRLGFKNGGGRK